tara:strand:+ start:3109 stop:3390 length:282 start_codon:yes stop_codon:yes gene_type:complete
MCDIEQRYVCPSVITTIYTSGELKGAMYRGFFITITRVDYDIEEFGASNSKLEAEYVELVPRPMCKRRIGSIEVSPYSASYEECAAWIDENLL